MKNELELVEQKMLRVDRPGESVDLFQELVRDCPMPTDEELRKLCSIQAVMLLAVSSRLMTEAMSGKKIDRNKLQLALNASAQCRAASESAARIKVPKTGGS